MRSGRGSELEVEIIYPEVVIIYPEVEDSGPYAAVWSAGHKALVSVGRGQSNIGESRGGDQTLEMMQKSHVDMAETKQVICLQRTFPRTPEADRQLSGAEL